MHDGKGIRGNGGTIPLDHVAVVVVMRRLDQDHLKALAFRHSSYILQMELIRLWPSDNAIGNRSSTLLAMFHRNYPRIYLGNPNFSDSAVAHLRLSAVSVPAMQS